MKTLILSTMTLCLLTSCTGYFRAGYEIEGLWHTPKDNVEVELEEVEEVSTFA